MDEKHLASSKKSPKSYKTPVDEQPTTNATLALINPSEQSQTLSSHLSSSPTKKTVKKKVQFLDAPMVSAACQGGDNKTNETCMDDISMKFNVLRLSVDGVKEKEEGNSEMKEGREKGWNSYKFSLDKKEKEKRKRADDADAATIEKEDRSKIVKLQQH